MGDNISRIILAKHPITKVELDESIEAFLEEILEALE